MQVEVWKGCKTCCLVPYASQPDGPWQAGAGGYSIVHSVPFAQVSRFKARPRPRLTFIAMSAHRQTQATLFGCPAGTSGVKPPSRLKRRRVDVPQASPIPINRILANSRSFASCSDAEAHDGAQAPGKPPTVPARGACDAVLPAKKVMKDVVLYVDVHLRLIIRSRDRRFSQFADVPLFQHPALCLPSLGAPDGPEDKMSLSMSSYKSTWDAKEASASLGTSGMYEAGGSLWWCNPFPTSDQELILAGRLPTFEDLHAVAGDFCVQQTSQTAPDQRSGRIVFPRLLIVCAPTPETFALREFAGCLRLLNGHLWLWGWYLQTLQAITTHDLDRVALLLQAALTVTLQARVGSDEELALVSMQTSVSRHIGAKSASDSFLFFTKKLELAVPTARDGPQKLLQTCMRHRITFNGLDVSKGMAANARALAKMPAPVVEALLELENKYGAEALTGQHHCLGRLLSICNHEAQNPQWGDDAPTLVLLFLAYAEWGLAHGHLKPADITVEWLDKSKHGTPGACLLVLAKARLVAFFGNMLRDMPDSHGQKQEALETIRDFTSYRAFGSASKTPHRLCSDARHVGSASPEGARAAQEDAKQVSEIANALRALL